MFVVLVSKHRYHDDYTTQFSELVNAMDRNEAISKVRAIFPPIYLKYGNDLIAYFTGETYVII